MKKSLILILFLLLVIPFSFAQQISNNAATHYKKAFELMQYPDLRTDTKLIKQLNEVIDNGWGEKNKELESILKANKAAFREFYKGLRFENCDFTFGKKVEHLILKPLPNLLYTRQLSELLLLKGRWYERNGDFKKAINNYLAILTFAFHISKNESLVTFMVTISIESLAFKPIEEYLNQPNTEKETCRRLLNFLTKLKSKQTTLAQALEYERVTALDTANMAFAMTESKIRRANPKLSEKAIKGITAKSKRTYDKVLMKTQDKLNEYFNLLIQAAKTGKDKDWKIADEKIAALIDKTAIDSTEGLEKMYFYRNMLNLPLLNKLYIDKLAESFVTLQVPNLLRLREIYYPIEEKFNLLINKASSKIN